MKLTTAQQEGGDRPIALTALAAFAAECPGGGCLTPACGAGSSPDPVRAAELLRVLHYCRELERLTGSGGVGRTWVILAHPEAWASVPLTQGLAQPSARSLPHSTTGSARTGLM